MATKQPTSVEIRSFQVGFGDCFLVTFVYSAKDRRHVLIDFGTTALPSKLNATPAQHMPQVAQAIKTECGGKLAAVVATHRHADHISGFASGGAGKIIAQCNPHVVMQPWTEDPDAARGATSPTVTKRKAFVASLTAMHRIAGTMRAFAENPPTNLSVSVVRQLRFLGEDNIRNRSAVDNLMAMGKRKGTTAIFAHHGSDAGLGSVLPGVKVRVLGPPTLEQTEKIRKMRSSDKDQFWQLLGGARALHGMGVKEIKDRSNGRRAPALPVQARWFRDRLAVMTGEQLLEIVRVLDDQMNNTSLILLFEVGDKKLLFPGDAQIENWSYALEDAPDAAATRKLLADVDFYKVGHHGSRNATPKKLLWESFTKRGTGKKRMQTVLSTLPGKHGTAAKKTEVPRKTLLQALETETSLCNTTKLKLGRNPEMFAKVVVKV
jgi:hypothetical protein